MIGYTFYSGRAYINIIYLRTTKKIKGIASKKKSKIINKTGTKAVKKGNGKK